MGGQLTIISLLLRYAMARRFTRAENTSAQLQSVDAHVLPYDRNPKELYASLFLYHRTRGLSWSACRSNKPLIVTSIVLWDTHVAEESISELLLIATFPSRTS